ncbi:PAS domain-containing protein [Bosea sp. (in: a-proteobacteria)]|uniref:PAS domain-containing protein n=1 Tax=Bosea sp. (in: a-proteobacteria) TaxID=1871050 RepID=UPI0026228E73|nr:PAS domain-containing protein [Bosea sp. (in: a-proteobacteria)]MCO5090187.1 PAS domain-containing protein [Bosea sp. (in: a-proteobacteria)]
MLGSMIKPDLVRQFDWAATSAGPIEQWPEPLRHAARFALLSAEPMAVLLGREGLIVCNDAVHHLFGAHYAGSLGKPIEAVFPDYAAFCREAIDLCFDGIGSQFDDEPMRMYRNGAWETAWFHVCFTPLADVNGTVSGVLLNISETTASVLALRDARNSRERLEIALDAGGIIGTWDLDVAANRLTCDERFARLFGMGAETGRAGINNNALAGLVHLDDRARVRNALAETVRTGVDYKCRYRIITAQGDTRWCFDAGRAVRDESGAIVKLCGVVIDLTSQIAAEDALADSERRFHGLIESIPQIVWSADREARHDYFNARWNEFTGLDPTRLDAAAWEKLVHPEDWPRVSQRWSECVATGLPYDIEYRFLHHSGQYRWLRVMALPVRGADGEIMRWYGTSTDIEESKAIEMERELVADELEHRIRNLFALVNGLVTLSAREDAASAAFADRFRRRLSALHKAHEFIRGRAPVHTGAKSVQALARAILAPYDDHGRIAIMGEDVTLQDHLVTPLALVFHELATNSAKYGALASDGGSLSLTFRCADEKTMLSWVEAEVAARCLEADGGGFGSKLLTQTIERQLKGRFSRAVTPAGLSFEMEIPT